MEKNDTEVLSRKFDVERTGWLTPARKQTLVPSLLITPAFIILGAILMYPTLDNIRLSFLEGRLATPHLQKVVRFKNDVKLFTGDEENLVSVGGTVELVEPLGSDSIVMVDIGGSVVTIRMVNSMRPSEKP